MAVWQATFALEPDLKPLSAHFRSQLSELLPAGKVWSDYQEAWGSEDSNRVDIWSDPRGATEVRVRFDLRELDAHWLARVVELVAQTGRHFQFPDGRAVEPNLGEVMLALRGSPAWRFVSDPQGFLDRISRGDYQDG